MNFLSDRLAALYDSHGEKLRYLVVGVCNTAIGYVVFIALLATVGAQVGALSGSAVPLLDLLGRNYYLVAQWLGWVLMVPLSTTTMKYFAFRSRGKWLRQVGRAYLVYLPAQGLSSLLLWLTVEILHLSPQLGQLVAIAFATVFSYLGHKYFTFRVPLEVGEVAPEDLIEPHRF